MIVWVIAGLLGLATGLRIGWALANKQSVVSTAMILALGSLAVVAALNWPPLTLLVDSALGWPNIVIGLSQVGLIGCAAGSSVMITTVGSGRNATTARRIAIVQYAVAAAVAALSLVVFLSSGQQPEMTTEEYLRHNIGPGGAVWVWLLPLLYVIFALTLVAGAGIRHSNRSRRGRALFGFTVGAALIVVASALLLIRAVGRTEWPSITAVATVVSTAMVIVAAASLLPSIEDWFGARRELRIIDPLLTELNRRHPDAGIGERPRGPLVFRVAERMSLISDALFLEATLAIGDRDRVDAAGRGSPPDPSSPAEDLVVEVGHLDPPAVSADEQARAVAEWIYAGRGGQQGAARKRFPGLNWLRQPETHSDREWILAIAEWYRRLERRR
ncbi:hypothetical protein [Mycolicibacterium thermoresistibile]